MPLTPHTVCLALIAAHIAELEAAITESTTGPTHTRSENAPHLPETLASDGDPQPEDDVRSDP